MKIQGIIFDCDGVLVDSETISAKAWSEICQQKGVDKPAQFFHDNMVGGSIGTALDFVASLVSIANRKEVEMEYRKLTDKYFFEELQPIEGIEILLKNLKLPRCVASNGPLEKVKQNLKITGLDRFFKEELLFSGHDYGFKPKPDMYLHAAEALRLSPGQCLVIEDSLVGARAAKAANIPCVFYDPSGKQHIADVETLTSIELIAEYIHKRI